MTRYGFPKSLLLSDPYTTSYLSEAFLEVENYFIECRKRVLYPRQGSNIRDARPLIERLANGNQSRRKQFQQWREDKFSLWSFLSYDDLSVIFGLHQTLNDSLYVRDHFLILKAYQQLSLRCHYCFSQFSFESSIFEHQIFERTDFDKR